MQISKYRSVQILFIFLPAILIAQQNTISPYSSFGIGEVQPQEFSLNNALGGVGAALRTEGYLNPLNPASLSAINTTVFEAGIMGTASYLTDNTLSQESFTSTLSHLSLGFPILDGIAISGGLLPYSFKGFELKQNTDSSNGLNNLSYDINLSGSGGFNRAYVNAGAELFKGLSLGATVSMIFGTIQQNRDVVFSQSDILNRRDEFTYTARDYKYDFGFQYLTEMGAKNLIIGATYCPESNLNSRSSGTTYSYDLSGDFEYIRDTLEVFSNSTNGLVVPQSYSIGLALEEQGRWFVSGELDFTEWSQMTLFSELDPNLKDATQFKFGAWWIPNAKDVHNYFNIIQYRAGFNYNTGQLSVSAQGTNDPQTDITDISLSFGLGLPMRRSNTVANLGVQVGKTGTTSGGLIEENYIKLHLAFTFNDKWFKKRKID
tara:strand:- start:1992 stop:3287 length:1296 start_codon:yes stop_codon:yes gene_type:complete